MSENKKSTNKPFRDILKFGCLGVLIGFLIIAIIQLRISYINIMSIRQDFNTRLNNSNEPQYLYAKAQYVGLKGDFQSVIDILAPNMNKFTNRSEAADAYLLLGTAEYQLGHPLLAAGYFELTYANNPIAHNLYTLALAYDAGGNLDKALEKFSLALAIQDGTVQPQEIAYAQQRIQEIMTIKGINNQRQ